MAQIIRPEADYGGMNAVTTFMALGMKCDKKDRDLESVKFDMDFCESEIKRLSGPSVFIRLLSVVATIFEFLGCAKTSKSVTGRISSHRLKASARLLIARRHLKEFQVYINTTSESTGKFVRSAFAPL